MLLVVTEHHHFRMLNKHSGCDRLFSFVPSTVAYLRRPAFTRTVTKQFVTNAGMIVFTVCKINILLPATVTVDRNDEFGRFSIMSFGI